MPDQTTSEPTSHAPAGDDEAIHGWFELTYSNYAVFARSLMQSMPAPWQARAVAVFEELQAAYAHLGLPEYHVQAGEWRYPGDLTEAQLTAQGITCTKNGDDETWYDKVGDELDPHQPCAFVPSADPIPHYNRGRTHVPRADELATAATDGPAS